MKPKSFDEPIIEDSDEFNFQSSLGIEVIAMEQYRRCLVEGSKDMVRGGITKKLVGGKVVEIEVPNQRQIFINCVKSMRNLLTSFISNGEYQENYKDKLKVLDDELNKFVNIKNKQIDKLQNESKYYDGRKYVFNFGYYNKQHEIITDEYETILVGIYRTMLELFGFLLNELDYFKEGGVSA